MMHYARNYAGDTIGPAYCDACAPARVTTVDDPELDGPEHCAGCEELLDHRLTPDGLDYVREALAAPVTKYTRPEILDAWRNAWRDELAEAEAADPRPAAEAA